ncbi:hypothetical protein HYW44_02545 [Candidatus Daviesbacteria bacterium]|nr:hypothetical protein [Candidatus Daviesbacteria bacterium]
MILVPSKDEPRLSGGVKVSFGKLRTIALLGNPSTSLRVNYFHDSSRP